MTPAQLAYAGPTKPAEEFYDCVADPLNVRNLLKGKLTDDESLALTTHRSAYRKERRTIQDVGALPESVAHDYVRDEAAPLRDITLGETHHRPDLSTAWQAADLVGKGTEKKAIRSIGVG